MVAFKNVSSCTFLLQGTVLLFSRFFVENPKYLCFNGAKNFHKVTYLGELNATEIQQNIIEMFFVRVYFGCFATNCFLAHKAVSKSLIFF